MKSPSKPYKIRIISQRHADHYVTRKNVHSSDRSNLISMSLESVWFFRGYWDKLKELTESVSEQSGIAGIATEIQVDTDDFELEFDIWTYSSISDMVKNVSSKKGSFPDSESRRSAKDQANTAYSSGERLQAVLKGDYTFLRPDSKVSRDASYIRFIFELTDTNGDPIDTVTITWDDNSLDRPIAVSFDRVTLEEAAHESLITAR